MSKDGPTDQDFVNLPPDVQAGIEALSGVGLHHAPDQDRSADALAAEAEDEAAAGEFRHPEHDAAGTEWEPDWEPLDTYQDGDVVMLDDGSRQILGMREMGMWMEMLDGDAIPQPDYQPMLWSTVPDQVKYDMM